VSGLVVVVVIAGSELVTGSGPVSLVGPALVVPGALVDVCGAPLDVPSASPAVPTMNTGFCT
jgi:hypothetical protein